MTPKTLEKDGERFIPTQSFPVEVLVNMERYHYVMSYCNGMNVLELGCGCGLGTYLYSLVANHVTAVDYNQDALDYAEQYPSEPGRVTLRRMNLETDPLPAGDFDVTIATEFLEHVADPKKLLDSLKTQYLIFSLPLDSMKVSTWHKFGISGGDKGIEEIKALISDKFRIEDIHIQQGRWIYGMAKKKKSWL